VADAATSFRGCRVTVAFSVAVVAIAAVMDYRSVSWQRQNLIFC